MQEKNNYQLLAISENSPTTKYVWKLKRQSLNYLLAVPNYGQRMSLSQDH